MPRRFQFSLKTMLIDMGLLCLSLGAFSWAHSISVWSSWDDNAVIVVSGILAAIGAIPLGCRFLRLWSLLVTFVYGLMLLSYLWTMLPER